MPHEDAKSYTYTVVVDHDAEAGGYVATCPALPGVVTEGDTIEEALRMASDAIRGYLESLVKDGLAIPKERGSLVSPITVHLATV